MPEFIPHHFEKLKTELLEVSGIKQILPSDCKRLSADIYSKTHKQISETTLKRVFGFAYTPFKPSEFTISALAEYCGYSGWKNFSQQCDKTERQLQPRDAGWSAITDECRKLTSFTLQTLKNRSGIPYQLTADRKFIDEHLEIFAAETYTGTILSAPEGYGKTTALCHWVDKQLKNTTNSDIILFLKCGLVTGYTASNTVTACIHTLLGIAAGNELFDIQVFDTNQPKGKFYLIIDGINELSHKPNEFYQLFNQLADIVSLYQRYDWFKVVLSMRSATWINNRHIVLNKTHNWFMGFMTDYHRSVNVPLLDNQEIALVADLIEPLNTAVVQDIHLNNLAHPLYFQYYYQLNQRNFSLNKLNNLTTYHLTTEHVVQKVYRGKFNDDKVLLLRRLINSLEYENDNWYINLLHVADDIQACSAAYHDLLSAGILKLTDQVNALNYQKQIMFNGQQLLHFVIAEKLISDNNGQFNDNLIELLKQLPGNLDLKLPVIKWLLFNMITGSQSIHMTWLEGAGLTATERSEIFIMLGELLAGRNDHQLKDLFIAPAYQANFNLIVTNEFMGSKYKETLSALSNFNLSDEQALILKLNLGFVAMLQLDIPNLEKCISELKGLSAKAYLGMLVNPIHFLEAAYFYLKFGIIKKEVLASITRFYFNPLITGPANKSGTHIESMIAIGMCLLYQDQYKPTRFINAMLKTAPNSSTGNTFLLKIWLAGAYITLNHQEAFNQFDDLSKDYYSAGDMLTSFARLSYHLTAAKINFLKTPGNQPHHEFKQLLNVCEQRGYKLIKVAAIAHILNNALADESDKKLLNQYYFDLVKTVRGCGCRTESFLMKPVNASKRLY